MADQLARYYGKSLRTAEQNQEPVVDLPWEEVIEDESQNQIKDVEAFQNIVSEAQANGARSVLVQQDVNLPKPAEMHCQHLSCCSILKSVKPSLTVMHLVESKLADYKIKADGQV